MAVDAKPEENWLAVLPFSLFSMSLGYAGLAVAWRQAGPLYGTPPLIADILMIIALMVFVALTYLQVRRFFLDSTYIAEEFRDPVKASFFATFSMSLLSLAGSVLVHSTALATALWLVGAAAQFVLAIAIIGRWFERDCDVTYVNPGWFLPSAGNLLVPITGQKLGFEELSWFFFAVGFVFWVILFVILLYRVIFLGPFPRQLAPTLFVFLAPPSLAVLAIEALTGEIGTPISKVLIYIGLFFAILLAGMWRRFEETPFSPVWWSVTFPTAAFAAASERYAAHMDTVMSHTIAVAALALCTGAVVVISVLTVRAARAGTLFAPS